MIISILISCQDIQESIDFYKKILTPIGRTVIPYSTGTGFGCHFIYDLRLSITLGEPSHQHLSIHGVDIMELAELLENLLPKNDDLKQPLPPAHWRGPHPEIDSHWIEISDPDGNIFHMKEFRIPTAIARISDVNIALTPIATTPSIPAIDLG